MFLSEELFRPRSTDCKLDMLGFGRSPPTLRKPTWLINMQS